MEKRLYKNSSSKMISGVCSGISEVYNIDVSIIRLLFVILTAFFCGAGLITYIALAIVLPEKPIDITYEEKAD